MADELQDARGRVTNMLALAKSIRDNLNKNVLSDSMYENVESVQDANDRIEKIKRELDWTVRQIRN